MFDLFFFLLGLIIGSFLNVVIYRYNTGMTMGGRSQCFSCGRTLAWYDLIPVVSFILFHGRCRECRSRISWQYPAVELLTGFVFLALYWFNGLSSVLPLDLIIWSTLIVLMVYDFRHKILPDGLVALFVSLAYVRIFLTIPQALWHSTLMVWALLAGPILFIPFFLLWYVSKGTWMGLGDGKLAIGMGALLGLSLGASAVVLAFWIGAGIMLLYMGIVKIFGYFHHRGRLSFLSNKLTMKSEIPFAPFLIVALWIVFYWQLNLIPFAGIL